MTPFVAWRVLRGLPLLALLALVPLPAVLSAAPQALEPRPELLVSDAWLAERLERPGLRVVDLRGLNDYRGGHIPGAVHMPIRALSVTRDGVRGLLPPVEEVQATFRAAGIGADTTVVAYDDRGGLAAARLFWALDYLGQERGRVLDGGWPVWVEEGRPVTREVPRVAPSDFVARPVPGRLATLDWVRGHLGDAGTAIVDARRVNEYVGEVRYSRRGGHIPGARLLNWREHLDPGASYRLRPLDELRRRYAELGLPQRREVVVYCQTMMRAAHTYFVLKLLGYANVRGYDGSWAEWGNRRDTPVKTGP